jgi:uncharacterized membrane protein YcjF (UPF0283 family)
MSDVLHANIFFFITSVAVVAVGLLLVVVLWYVISILREVREITRNVRRASEGLEADLNFLRSEVKSGAAKVGSLLSTAVSFALGRLTRPTRRPPRRKNGSSATVDNDSV